MKRNKFLHNSFFNYFRAINFSSVTNARSAPAEIWIAAITAGLAGFVVSSMNTADAESGIALFCFDASWVALVVSYIIGYRRRKKPSTLNLMPINYKKRVLYSYLSALLSTVIVIILFLVCFMVLMLLIALIILATTGEWVFVIEQSESVVAICAQGQAFSFFFWLFVFGGGMMITYFKKPKTRYIAMVAFVALLEIIALLFINMLSVGYEYEFALSGNVAADFEKLPLSWLWLTGFGLIAVGVFAASVCCALDAEKPKDF